MTHWRSPCNFAAVSPETEPSQWVKPVSVVIAEDHVAIGTLLSRLLEARGAYRVLEQFTRGADVARRCHELRPQLLILDIELPDMSGLQVAREVAATTPETHILVFSGNIHPEVVCDALRAGVRGILEKTAGLELLESAVATVSLGRDFFGPAVLPILPQALRLMQDAPTDGLTDREREILVLVAEGMSNRAIAQRLGISERTVGNHRANTMGKLGAHNAADLTREAMRLGLVRPRARNES